MGWDAREGCLLKAERGGERVKRGRSEQTLESSTNSDGSFIRGRLRYTKLCLLHDGSAKNEQLQQIRATLLLCSCCL